MPKHEAAYLTLRDCHYKCVNQPMGAHPRTWPRWQGGGTVCRVAFTAAHNHLLQGFQWFLADRAVRDHEVHGADVCACAYHQHLSTSNSHSSESALEREQPEATG